MNSQDQARFATQLEDVAKAYKGAIKTFGSDLPGKTLPPKPMQKKQEGSDIMLLELRPAAPCLYSVGAGEHAKFRQDQGRLFVCHLSLFYRVNQKTAGRGRNLQSALGILGGIEKKRPDFFLPNGYEWRYLHIFKRYYGNEHPKFSAKAIADDLAWLVSETYEEFRQLPRQ
jgi:hypothetical protein